MQQLNSIKIFQILCQKQQLFELLDSFWVQTLTVRSDNIFKTTETSIPQLPGMIVGTQNLAQEIKVEEFNFYFPSRSLAIVRFYF